MKNKKDKVILLTLLIFVFLIPFSQAAPAQELGAGAKLVGTSPFIFAEAKLWVFSAEVGAGLSSTDETNSEHGYEPSPVDFSFTGKVYPIKIMNFSPYLGYSNRLSSSGNFKQSRMFGGVEFDFPGGGLPLLAFAGGGMAFTEAEGAGLGWHLGVKYKF